MGYNMPTFLRFAVRAPEHQRVLLAALRAHFSPGETPSVGDADGVNAVEPSSSSVWRTFAANLDWALKFSSQ
jgi:hypothetical protein